MDKYSVHTDTAVQCPECFGMYVKVQGKKCPHCECKAEGHIDGGGFCRRCEAVLPMQPQKPRQPS